MNRSEKAAWIATALLPLIAITALAVAPLWWALMIWTLIPVSVLALTLIVARDEASPPRDLPSDADRGYNNGYDLRHGRTAHTSRLQHS